MVHANRKNTRLANWDYASSACYHVTFCTQDKKKTLGSIVRSDYNVESGIQQGQPIESCFQVILSALGEACRESILDTAQRYDGFTVDKFVIMPNHVHMLVMVDSHEARTTLGTFIGRVKSGASRISIARGHGKVDWQRGYYDHIIRGESDYADTWKYIDDNPAKWADDEYFT